MFRLRTLAAASAHARPLLRTYARPRLVILPRPVSQSLPILRLRRNHNNAAGRPKLCPSCSSSLPTALPVCPNCSYIAPIPESMTYHEMFGMPYEPNPFIVDDERELKNKFRAVQAVVHPDRWVGKPPEQQAIAAAMSSRVNSALHHLSSPLRRVEYILSHEGHAGNETDKAEDMELLMEVMEAREGMASASCAEEVEEIRLDNAVKMQDTLDEIEKLVAAKDWEAVRAAAVKLKYLVGIESAAAVWPAVVHDH